MVTITQIQMAEELGLNATYFNQILAKIHPISRPLAEKLAETFPGTTYQEWRQSDPEAIRKAFKAREAK